MNKDLFPDIACRHISKEGENSEGDIFIYSKDDESGYIHCVLADGIGSGIRANVSAVIAAKAVLGNMRRILGPENTQQHSRLGSMLSSVLPAVKSKGSSAYAAFCAFSISPNAVLSLVEMGMPAPLLFRDGVCSPVERTKCAEGIASGESINCAKLNLHENDRLIVISDGVRQAGSENSDKFSEKMLCAFIKENVKRDYEIDANTIANKICLKASAMDSYSAKDDISTAAVYLRKTKTLNIATGAPIEKARDAEYAQAFMESSGSHAVCGGTTAGIIARERGLEIETDVKHAQSSVIPVSKMDNVEIVSEGVLTLNATLTLLRGGEMKQGGAFHAGAELYELIKRSDRVSFLVGLKQNEAHYKAGMPEDFGIRINLVKEMKTVLKEKYHKEVSISYY